MPTVREHVEKKLSRFGLDLTPVEMDSLLSENGIDDNTQLERETLKQADNILIMAIPELLLLPDVSEGDVSIRRDRKAIVAYYGLLCKKWNLPNLLAESGSGSSGKATITDKSNLW